MEIVKVRYYPFPLPFHSLEDAAHEVRRQKQQLILHVIKEQVRHFRDNLRSRNWPMKCS